MNYIILSLSLVNLLLSIIILVHSKGEKENIVFLFFTSLVTLWTLNNFYNITNPATEILRISYAIAAIVALLYLIWLYLFLNKSLPTFLIYGLIPYGIALAIITACTSLTVQVQNEVTLLGYEGQLGVLYGVYGLYFTIIIVLALYNLGKSLRTENDHFKKIQLSNILTGATIFAVASFAVSFVVPTVFQTLRYTILDSFSFCILISYTVFAIVRNELFINRKIIVTEVFVFILWVALLIRTIISQNSFDVIANAVILSITIIVGALLMRSVIEEIRFREEIEVLAIDLENANERQATLIHFMSHEIKGFLTKSRNIFSMILEGDYGSTTHELGNTAKLALDSDTKGISMVQEILSAANLKKGTTQYFMEKMSVKKILLEVIEYLKKDAEEKNVAIIVDTDDADNFEVVADKEQIRHALKNIVDNAIKYTLVGEIRIHMRKVENKVVCSVRDTGIGVSAEDRPRLFTEGGAGRKALKTNVDSSGYGLYIAKKIMDAHHGRIWFESPGEGMGSTFFIELPTVQPAVAT